MYANTQIRAGHLYRREEKRRDGEGRRLKRVLEISE